MACLDNYINIKGHCSEITPSSGLYINTNLPGISLEQAANVAEGALPTGILLLEQAIQNGIARVRQELVTALLPKVRFNQIISGGEYGTWNPDTIAEDSAYLATSATGRGVVATLKSCCRLANMYIPRIGIVSKTTYPVNQITITVKDSTTSTTYSPAITGKNITWVEIKQKIESDLVRITIADTGKAFEPYDTTLGYSGNCGFCANECSGCADCTCSSGLNVYGWDGTNNGNQTFGIIPVIQVICDPEKFFCEISHLEMVEWAVLYAAGIDFMNSLKTTNRVNVYTLYQNIDEVNAIILDWETKLQTSLTTLRETLPVYLNTIDSCCIECNASTWAEMLP